MLTLRLRRASVILALTTSALMLQAEDLHYKKTVSVGGSSVSNSEIWLKGARERTVSSTPGGNVITLRQCDLKRTLTINDQSQSYMTATDPQDEAALKAAALMGGTQAPATGGTVTQTITVTDTGERKPIHGYTARHLKTSVLVESSANACSPTNQKYEIDGWYADFAKEQASCAQSLPPIRQAENCSDQVIVRRKGAGKPGSALAESITLHNGEDVTKIDVTVSDISKQTLDAGLFDVPAGYREVKTYAELNNIPQAPQAYSVPQSAAYSTPPTQQAAQGNAFSASAAAAQFGMGAMGKQSAIMAQAQQAMGGMQGMGSQFQNGGMGGEAAGGMAPAQVPIPQALGPKAPGKIRIGIAPAQAQLGQGNNAQADYGTPIRNAIILIMNGPAVEITGLDAHIPMQLQAEAQQKQCDYILFSSVTVKHASGGFGSFMKKAGPMTNMIPMVGMAGGMTGAMAGQAAGMAAQAAAQAAQQQAVNQLSGFNGQIKSKDDVTVEYQLYPTGQPTIKLQNSLNAKAKSNGEDVMTPLIQQAATAVLTEVSKK
jgi:hypothetical protein